MADFAGCLDAKFNNGDGARLMSEVFFQLEALGPTADGRAAADRKLRRPQCDLLTPGARTEQENVAHFVDLHVLFLRWPGVKIERS